MRILTSTLAALLAAAPLAGCASDPVQPSPSDGGQEAKAAAGSDARNAQLYRAHAGEPVDGFVGRVNNWTVLDEESLVVWTGVNRGYLLELVGPCIELPWAQRITFTNDGFTRIGVFDDVIVLGRQPQTMPCPIREIRPVDGKAVKAAQRQEREGAG